MRKKRINTSVLSETELREHITIQNREKSKRYYYTKGKYVTSWRIRAKQKLIAYKGGKCQRCGYNKDVPGAYDFHHRDPKEKTFSIGNYGILNLEKIIKEVDKCDLVCKNCHAEIHDEQYKKQRQILLEQHEVRKITMKQCVKCSKIFKPAHKKSEYCSIKCRRKVDRPNKQELIQLIAENTWVSIGEKFGVSDNAVRKWAKTYNIF